MTDSAASQDQQIWDATQYESALAHLYRLQEQIDGLRGSIASIVTPLTRPSDSKPQLFAEIKKAAVSATEDVKTFQENWRSDKTKELLARSKDDFEKNGDLSKAEGVERWGWAEREEGKK